MATKVRVEWVVLASAADGDRAAPNVLKLWTGTPVALVATSTATAAGSRPVAPAVPGVADSTARSRRLYARVSALDGNVIVEASTNPTAGQDNGILVQLGCIELIPVAEGDKLSFIELA